MLVAPLDWGLGHATRCIPIIRELIRQDCEVWIGCDGANRKLLENQFPTLSFIDLPGYHVQYSISGKSFGWKIFRQIPKIVNSIYRENRWLKKKIKEHRFSAVISDNRFGLFHRSVRSVFITHQLTIKSPLGRWSEKLLQRLNYRYINRFSICWVPDFAGENNLAGELSHPSEKPSIPVVYIGCLSRFTKTDAEEKANHLLILLSGPEPQRTILENKIIANLKDFNGTATIVRGLPLAKEIPASSETISFYNHLSTEQLSKKIAEAEFVISRSGYSTIMDLTQFEKKSIFIPTPGQTEQEYLGQYLMQNKIALSVNQNDFSLIKDLETARHFSYLPFKKNESLLAETIHSFVEGLTR
ncbi:MAG: glycosyltransferase [Chitinophagaceae bacterium]